MKMKSYHNKNKRAVRLWLLLPFLLMASVVEAQVTVDVRIDSLELWVGEQTRITLDVSTDTKSKLVMPQVKAGDMLTPGVEVVEVAKADTQQLNEGARRLVSQSYIVTSFDSALYYLPPLVVKVDGKEYQLNPLFLYERGERYEEGRLVAKGRLARVERLKDYGQMQAYLQAMEVFDAGYDIQ